MTPRGAARLAHRFIASVATADVEVAAQAIRAAAGRADMVEVRLDRLWPAAPDPDAATDALLAVTEAGLDAGLPLIATLRPLRAGGAFSGDEATRVGLLAAALQAGFAAVDLETDAASPSLIEHLGQVAGRPVDAIVSTHHMGPTPCRDDGLTALTAAQDAGGVLDKFAFSGHSFADTLRALEIASQHNAKGGRPVVSTVGHGDAQVRALLAIAGNHATYGHAQGVPAAVPGQPALDDIRAVLEYWGLSRDELAPHPVGARAWLAVLGHPVAHSLSPRIQNAALRAAGRPERFGALDVPASAGALLLTLHAAQRIGLVACSVMAPHKRDLARVATCDAVAQAVGAANCARIGPKGVEATNTDATALRRLLRPHVASGTRAVVVGAGAAARAAIWALGDLGAEVQVTSRDAARGAAAAATRGATWTPWDSRASLRAPVWVQATPAFSEAATAAAAGGPAQQARSAVAPAMPEPVVGPGQLRGCTFAVELDYAAGPTAFEAAARAAGAEVVDGRRVLLEQGADAFRFWLGREPDRDAMAAALGVPAARTVEV